MALTPYITTLFSWRPYVCFQWPEDCQDDVIFTHYEESFIDLTPLVKAPKAWKTRSRIVGLGSGIDEDVVVVVPSPERCKLNFSAPRSPDVCVVSSSDDESIPALSPIRRKLKSQVFCVDSSSDDDDIIDITTQRRRFFKKSKKKQSPVKINVDHRSSDIVVSDGPTPDQECSSDDSLPSFLPLVCADPSCDDDGILDITPRRLFFKQSKTRSPVKNIDNCIMDITPRRLDKTSPTVWPENWLPDLPTLGTNNDRSLEQDYADHKSQNTYLSDHWWHFKANDLYDFINRDCLVI